MPASEVSRILPLAFLAPDIMSVYIGRQSVRLADCRTAEAAKCLTPRLGRPAQVAGVYTCYGSLATSRSFSPLELTRRIPFGERLVVKLAHRDEWPES